MEARLAWKASTLARLQQAKKEASRSSRAESDGSKLFGNGTRVPCNGMLETLSRPYETYLNKLSGPGHLDVHGAFGGRGQHPASCGEEG